MNSEEIYNLCYKVINKDFYPDEKDLIIDELCDKLIEVSYLWFREHRFEEIKE